MRLLQAFQNALFISPPIGEWSIMMTVSVCVSLCVCLSVRDHSFGPTRAIFTKLFAHVTYGRSSVLLWRRSDMLCTSGFMYDVIFAHEPRSLDVSRPAEAQCTRSLGLGYKLCAIIPVASHRTHGTTFHY